MLVVSSNQILIIRLRLWKNPEYQICLLIINESTWGHNVLKPIINFIDYDLEDAITSQVSLERNSVKGPIKKYDISGVCKSEKYDLELLLSEISHGPLDETYKHSTEDRIQSDKIMEDKYYMLFDSLCKYYKTRSYNIYAELVKEYSKQENLFEVHKDIINNELE
ncbi:21100_t:CDS:2, partial [Gigaspora margarita]